LPRRIAAVSLPQGGLLRCPSGFISQSFGFISCLFSSLHLFALRLEFGNDPLTLCRGMRLPTTLRLF
jgi:hypothetical protein